MGFFFGGSFISFLDRYSLGALLHPTLTNMILYEYSVCSFGVRYSSTSEIRKYARDDNMQIPRSASFSTILESALGSYGTRVQLHLPSFHSFPPSSFTNGSFFSFLVWTNMLPWLVVLLAHIPLLLERFLPKKGVFATCSRTFLHSLAGTHPPTMGYRYSSTVLVLEHNFHRQDVPCDRDGQTFFSEETHLQYRIATNLIIKTLPVDKSERKLEGEKGKKEKRKKLRRKHS